MDTFSPTSLTTYDNCPAAFDFYTKTKGQQRAESEAMVLGAVVHKMLHAKALGQSFDRTVIKGVPVHIVEEALSMVHGFDVDLAVEDDRLEYGIAFDESLLPVGWDSPDRMIRMMFDRVGSRGQIDEDGNKTTTAYCDDYKTGFRKVPKDSLAARCYLLGLTLLYPNADAYQVNLKHTRYPKHFDPLYLTVSRDSFEIERLKQSVLDLIEMAKKDTEKKARIGPYCTTCPYATRCKALVDAGIGPTGSPESVANRWFYLKQQMADTEARLKELTESTPIEIGNGKMVGHYHAKRRVLVDRNDLVKEFAPNIDPEAMGFISLTNTTVDDAMEAIRTMSKTDAEEFKRLRDKYIGSTDVVKWGVFKKDKPNEEGD